MPSLIIQSATISVTITIQNWLPDNHGPLFDNFAKKGFIIQQPTAIQLLQGQMVPYSQKGTTSSVIVDNAARRVIATITNELTDPSKNIEDILGVMNLTGFPNESIERIDVVANVTMKIEGDEKASAFVPKVVNDKFVKSAEKTFERSVIATGMALRSVEPFTGSLSKSPFFVLIQPPLNDESDTRFNIQTIQSSNDAQNVVQFTRTLFERLKTLISHFLPQV